MLDLGSHFVKPILFFSAVNIQRVPLLISDSLSILLNVDLYELFELTVESDFVTLKHEQLYEVSTEL